MLAIILISVFIVYIVTCYIYKCVKNCMMLSKLPGPPRQGIVVGNILALRATPDKTFATLQKNNREYRPIYTYRAGHVTISNILSPEGSELILSNPVHNQKGRVYKVFHNWLRQGLLTSVGEKWQKRRKILTPAFHFNVLQQFVSVFNEEAEKLVEILRKESREKPHVDVCPHLAQFTLKTITETAMGTKLHFNTEKELAYKQAVYDIGKIFYYRVFHPWCVEYVGNLLSPFFFKERKVTKTLHQFTKGLIDNRERKFKADELPKDEHDVYRGKRRLAMLDLLLLAKHKGVIDDRGIHEEVDTFTFEGHDTTASALQFLLMLLACHKDSQIQIVEEMHQVLGDLHQNPTYNDLQILKYMERCIKESLRLYPSVFFVSRTLGEDVTTNDGYLLPKGTMTAVHIYDIHHNPDIYPDPEKFDPDRFLPENNQNRHPFAYLPFSAGPRNCIGQKFAMLELKAALCAILANFVLEPVDTPASIVLVTDLVLRARDGIKVRFVLRGVTETSN